MFGYMRQGPGFYRNVLSLAVPIILQNLITTSLGLADTLMVGALGEAPLAAVTLANIPVFVMQLLVFGLQSGSSVLISQYWGKGDRESINRVIGVGCYVAGAVSLLFALLMSGFPRQLMGLLTSDPALADIAAQYARIVGPSYIFNSLTSVYVGAHRSMENPRLGMIVFGISMCTNVFLNWVFIFGNLGAPRLEVEGAAIATLTSRVVELAAVAVYAARTPRFRLRPALVLRPGLELVGKFARYSAPVVLNETAWGLGTSLYKVVMGHMEGSVEILAARALAGNIEDVCTVIVFAVSGTTAIVVGREIGSGRDREGVYRVGKVMDTLALLCGLGIGILLLLASRLLLPQYVYPYFQLSQASADIATMMVTFTAVLLALRSFNSTNTVGVLRGGGDVRAALLIDNIPLWCVSLPLAALFGLVLKWGIFWVYIGIAMEQIVKFGAGVRRFRSWKWINDVTAPSRAQAAV